MTPSRFARLARWCATHRAWLDRGLPKLALERHEVLGAQASVAAAGGE